MSYVEQICDGYNKRSLMGNWYQERLYPKQAFRQPHDKTTRNKDQAITCFDDTGFQRSLPRLQRKHKWQTTGRIILDDGRNQKISVMKAQYPHGEQQSAITQMNRPFTKVSDNVNSTNVHPHSQSKNYQKSYHYLNNKNAQQLQVPRDVIMYRTDFRSTLPTHPNSVKQTHFNTIYRLSYNSQDKVDPFSKTTSQYHQTQKPAGNYNPNRMQSVRNISNMVGQFKKQQGDQKQVTKIQRTWYQAGDIALSHSLGKTAQDFKNKNIPVNDIQTNLNTNIGIHNIHPKEVDDNYFRHMRQDVTIQHNKTHSSKP